MLHCTLSLITFCRAYDRQSVTYSMRWHVWSHCPRKFVKASSSVCCRRCCSRRWWLSLMMSACRRLWRTTSYCGGVPMMVLWRPRSLAAYLRSSHDIFENNRRMFACADVARTHVTVGRHPEMSNTLTQPKSPARHKALTLPLVEAVYAVLYHS